MSEVRLQVKNLCKSFGITKAVQNVSFNVNKGRGSRADRGRTVPENQR